MQAQYFDSLNQYGHKATCIRTRVESKGVRVYAVCFSRHNLARREFTLAMVADQAAATAWIAQYRAASPADALKMVLKEENV